jgi:superfamily I DNA/RNA helicase
LKEHVLKGARIGIYTTSLKLSLKTLGTLGFCGGKQKLLKMLVVLVELYKFYLQSAGGGSYSADELRITDKSILEFTSWSKLVEYAEKTDDINLLSNIAIVEDFKRETLQKIQQQMELIKSRIVPEKDADFLLTTAHKAKGVEFDHVVLIDDFPDIMSLVCCCSQSCS